jgi:hypothetical protein
MAAQLESVDAGASEPSLDWSLAARELARRSLRWLEVHEAGLRAERHGGALAPVVELRTRLRVDGEAQRSLVVECRRAVVADDPPATLQLRLHLDERDHVEAAHAALTVRGRRKPLRHVGRGLRKPFPKTRTVTIEQEPDGGKHDPASLRIAVELDASKPVEELISDGLRMLEALVSEAVAIAPGR